MTGVGALHPVKCGAHYFHALHHLTKAAFDFGVDHEIQFNTKLRRRA